jgi:hypothetical protein
VGSQAPPGCWPRCRGAWIGISGPVPGLLDHIDPARIGRDSVSLIEWAQVIDRYEKGVPVGEMEWIDYGLGGLRADALDLVAPRSTTWLSSTASWRREASWSATRRRSASTRSGRRRRWRRRRGSSPGFKACRSLNR